MEEEIQQSEQGIKLEPLQVPAESSHLNKKKKKHHPVVIVARDWKEYLGESLLIIFSVALALIVTEILNNLHEKQQTKEIVSQLRDELIINKKAEEDQYVYHSRIVEMIDSALNDPTFANKFIVAGQVQIKEIINAITPPPHGLLLHDLNDVAWQVAKQNNIFSKIDLSTYSLLNDIYNNQQRITNSEPELARVLLSWESRKPENLRTTLILLRDNFLGWDVGRAQNLLHLYQQAIDKLANY